MVLFVSLNNFYQVEIIYEMTETFYNQKIECSTLEELIEKTEAFLKAYRDWNAYVYNATMFLDNEKILIKQKVIDLINRRKNAS